MYQIEIFHSNYFDTIFESSGVTSGTVANKGWKSRDIMKQQKPTEIMPMLFEEVGGKSNFAERVRHAIIDNGGYEYVSEITGISISTLKRIAAGKTQPKFKDVVDISEATRTPLMVLTYGNGTVLNGKFEMLFCDVIRETVKKGRDTATLRMILGMVTGALIAATDEESLKQEIQKLAKLMESEFDAPIVGRDI